MAKRFAYPLRTFLRRTDGSGTVEVVLAIVVLNLFLVAFYFWWGAYNAHALVDRTTYTISDLVTRQRGVELNRRLLDGLDRTAEFILDPDQDAAIRFTQVTKRRAKARAIPAPSASTGAIRPATPCLRRRQAPASISKRCP